MNNGRKNEINNFLRDLYESAKDNKIFYNENAIYHYLIKRNVPKKDRNIKFSEYNGAGFRNKLFDRWIDRFRNVSNINVFCAPNWRYFCQFINGRVDHSRCIKMYIPVDYNHIEESANRIFSFLAKNNISHLSKIGSEIRFDDIVVRLNSKEDALKLQKFIDNDKYIQEGMFKGNPFIFSNNGVNYAYDGSTSFNMCLSHLIALYLNNKIRNKNSNVNDVNADDFLDFIDKISMDVDCYKYFKELKHCPEKDEVFLIVNLLKSSLKSDNINVFWSYIDMVKDNNAMRKLHDIMINGTKKFDINDLMISRKSENKKELFDEVILTLMKKYPLGFDKNNKDLSGIDFIYSFLRGNIKGITRDNNLRNRVRNNLSRGDCFDIVINSEFSTDKSIIGMNNYIKIIMLNDIIRSMLYKYSINGFRMIDKYIKTGDPINITKFGGARNLAFSLMARDIRQLFFDLGVKDLDEYIEKYYNVDNKKTKTR